MGKIIGIDLGTTNSCVAVPLLFLRSSRLTASNTTALMVRFTITHRKAPLSSLVRQS